MRGRPHSDEVRAQVMAALLAGQGVCEIAERYKLTESTVRNWKKQLPEGQLAAVSAKKEGEFDDLLTDYLREIITTLSVQARHFRDTNWLAKQSASEAAVLHGVLTDKAIRLLEAAEVGGEPPGE